MRYLGTQQVFTWLEQKTDLGNNMRHSCFDCEKTEIKLISSEHLYDSFPTYKNSDYRYKGTPQILSKMIIKLGLIFLL